MNKCFYGGQTDEQIYRRMESWRKLAGWTNRLVDNWVDRWVNRYVDGGVDRYRHVDRWMLLSGTSPPNLVL